MTYFVKPNEAVTITEFSGTIQNTDQINKVEISETADFKDSIILYPLQKFNFNNIQLFARLFDNKDLPVELRVVPFAIGGGSSAGSGAVATDDEFGEMLDDIFPPTDHDNTPSGDTDSISGGVATDDEFDEMLDDIGI